MNKFFSKYITTLSDEDITSFIKGPIEPEGVDEWVDLGAVDEEKNGAENGDDSEPELIEIVEEEEEESSNGLLSDTTSIKKDKWRHRKLDLNDFKAFELLHEQVTKIQP